MKESRKPLYRKLLFSGIILLLILLMQPLEVYLFMKDIPLLFPKGLIAIEERNLLFIIQAIMLLFILPVYILTFIFSWWYRADNKKATYDPHLIDHKGAELIWWGLPFVMIILISIITWIKTYELDPYKPLTSDKKPITIEVVALQWRWLFIYPEEKIATINYFRFPTNTPLHFKITADAPMNSFWLPRLGGQIYAMPGMRTELHLIANEEGSFRGSSANISGEGFAGMTFIAEASSEESYKEWIESVRKSGKELNFSEYQQLALPSKDREVLLFQLKENDLFSEILMKYMQPPKTDSHVR